MIILLLASGHDVHSIRWANQLSENGNEVHLCYMPHKKSPAEHFNNDVILHELKIPAAYGGYYFNVFQLRRIIKSVNPDILNAHYASGYGTLGRLADFSPYLLSVYGSDVYDFPYRREMNMKIIRKNLKAPDALASTSHTMAVQTSNLINCSISNIHITPFGVDIKKFYKKNIKNAENTIVIGSIKKLLPIYGIRYGILAIDHLINNFIPQNLNVKYLIYGEGEEKAELKKLVAQCKLENIVEFKGKIPNESVPDALNEFDVFLGTSDSESFGVAIVEAMACEVPVVVTDADGFKEVVDNGNFGAMVPRRDYKCMAEEINKLIIEPVKSREIGSIQRKRVIEKYNWIENVNKMERIYKSLVENF
ncbi:glycosyltransferase [Lentibacillus salicampi]|uniref:Glycosyltransferase family 4 protein n=1 Tax=Lentibacillus salicampi TaxID=175306 RepID=A0A4Y9AAV7_9BACI|nr:glycosyltransferase [Lentibacillus salicampi]TFJ93049.1 glycosyltransferase family 4 protein [Lentibacillus salicampi]